MAILGLIGGSLLIIGIKPRATAATLAVLLLIFTIMDFTFFASSDWQQQHILQQYIPTKDVGFQKAIVSNWASQQIHLFLGKIAILGACLFIVGSRTIPHCVLARTESNLRNKYGE